MKKTFTTLFLILLSNVIIAQTNRSVAATDTIMLKEIYSIMQDIILAEKNRNDIKTDSAILKEISNVKQDINDLKEKHKKFEYQKNYFTEAIQSQRSVYKYTTMWATTILLIVAGLAGFLGFKKMQNAFDEKINKLSKDSKEVYNEINNLKIGLHHEIGNIYILQMNMSDSNLEKFKYCLLATQQYIISKSEDSSLNKAIISKTLYGYLTSKDFNTVSFNNIKEILTEIIIILKESEFINKIEIKEIIEEIQTSFNNVKPNNN